MAKGAVFFNLEGKTFLMAFRSSLKVNCITVVLYWPKNKCQAFIVPCRKNVRYATNATEKT
jgi:hypothetical protein